MENKTNGKVENGHFNGNGKGADEAFMLEALAAAREAVALGEVPVGCVVVEGGEIIARGHNLRETTGDPTAHAEIVALKLAAEKKGRWYLDRCTLYVTLEPCPMCAGALVNARIARLVYGATDPKAGACDSLYEIPSDKRLNHTMPVASGVLAEECGVILTEFFKKLRVTT